MKAGIIGTGHLGQHHVRIYSQHPEISEVFVYDEDVNKAKSLSEKFSTRFTEDIESLLKNVDIASIAVPTEHHYAIAKKALENNIHVLVEKPITSDISEAEELIQLADKSSKILNVGHIERFNPAFNSVDEYIKNPLFIEVHRIAGFVPRGIDVSVVLDLMIHDIDLIRLKVRSKVNEIKASGVAVLTGGEDIANVRLSFDNGCVANLTASRISIKPKRKIRFFQKDSYISIDFLENFAELVYVKKDINETKNSFLSLEQGSKDVLKFIDFKKITPLPQEPLKAEIDDFIQAVKGVRGRGATGKDALGNLKIAIEIIKEMRKTNLLGSNNG